MSLTTVWLEGNLAVYFYTTPRNSVRGSNLTKNCENEDVCKSIIKDSITGNSQVHKGNPDFMVEY